MAIFVRRQNPPHYSDYRQYKRYLRLDFEYRCAYCTIHEAEFGGHLNYHVDHFRPKSLFQELETVYINLYYACQRCNILKGDRWSTDAEISEGKRWIDPCEEDLYTTHFQELDDGMLKPLTAAAEYVCTHLRLNRQQLVLLRQKRREAEQAFQAGIIGLRGQLDQISQVLESGDLNKSDRQSLLLLQKAVQEQLIKKQEDWEKRLIPPYEMDDTT